MIQAANIIPIRRIRTKARRICKTGAKRNGSSSDSRLCSACRTKHCYRQTKEGSGHAKKEDGTEKRYLPKKAWEKMSEQEKEETDQKKQEESKQGKQHVSNTPKVCPMRILD